MMQSRGESFLTSKAEQLLTFQMDLQWGPGWTPGQKGQLSPPQDGDEVCSPVECIRHHLEMVLTVCLMAIHTHLNRVSIHLVVYILLFYLFFIRPHFIFIRQTKSCYLCLVVFF